MGHPRWEMLVQAMRESGGYDEARLKPSLLSRSYHAGRAVAGEDLSVVPRRITYYGSLLKTESKIWMEVAQIFISPPLRGNGLLGTIFDQLMARAALHHRLLLFSSSRVVLEVAQSKGFVEVSPEMFPSLRHWARALGIETRLPPSAFMVDKSAVSEGERRLLVKDDRSPTKTYFS